MKKKYPDGGKVKPYTGSGVGGYYNYVNNPPQQSTERPTSESLNELFSNMSSYFLGTKNPYTIPSPYRPSQAKDPKAQYTTWKYLRNDVKDDLLRDKHVQIINEREAKRADKDPKYLPTYIRNKDFGEYYEYYKNSPNSSGVSGSSINLGKYRMTAGEDKRGRYLSVHDTYDWDMFEGLGLHPFETYDRIYEDEWDKLKTVHNSDMKKTKKKMPGGGKVPKAPADSLANNQLYNQFVNFAPTVPIDDSPSARLRKVEEDAYSRYSAKPQKAYPDTGERVGTLTQGKLRGASPNKDIVNDLVAAADRAGVPRDQMLALAANESMFGVGYRGGGRRGKNDRGILQQNVISSWNLDQPYKPVPADQFAYSKGVPGVVLDRDKSGYKYSVPDPVAYKNSLDSALNVHPEWIDQYQKANANVRAQGDINYFDLTAQALRDKGLSSNAFNPGDPGYAAKIEAARKLVNADPALRPYIQRNSTTGAMENGGTMYYTQGSYFGPMYPIGLNVPPKVYENGGGLSRGEDYGSSKKPYPSVKKGDFAGGGRSYPIPTRADAIDALRLAGLHGREDVKSKVYKKYPDLKKAKYGYGVPNYAPIGNPMGMMAYGGTMFREGSSFHDCAPMYVHDYNGTSGIPPKVYDSGGIVPTARSFAASPFPPGFNRYPSYEPAWQSQFPEARYGYTTSGGYRNLPDQTIGTTSMSSKARGKKSKSNNGHSTPYYADNGASVGPYGDMLPVNQPININSGLMNPTPTIPYRQVDNSNSGSNTSGSQPMQSADSFGANFSLGTAAPIMALAGIVNQTTQRQNAANESARNTRRVAQTNIYNPYRQGTGATALYRNGGKVDPVEAALATLRDHGYDIEMG